MQGTPLRVLIIEDSEDDQLFIQRELIRGGFALTLQRVETGPAMQAALESQEWDVILADYLLPGFGGALALVLLQATNLDIPFIVVSGMIGEETAVEMMKAGAADYVMKGNLRRLPQAIRREIQETKARRDRRQAEEAVRQSEELFRQMAKNLEEVFWMSDPKLSQILYVSPAYETVWGRTCQSLYDTPEMFAEAVHPEDRAGLQEAIQAQRPSGSLDAEYRILRPDGSVRWIRNRTFPVRDAQGQYREAGIAQDITERKRTQETLLLSAKKLRVLAGRLVEVQEAERRVIARELHDQIGQMLFGLSLTLATGKRLTGEPLIQNQAQAEELVQDAISRVQQLSLELRPAMLDDLGLLPALIWHFQRFTKQTNVQVDFRHAHVTQRFPPEIETASYRIIQEALTNVARYAGVSKARVRLWARHNQLHVQIEDDGIGFVPEQALTNYTSSGLPGMQERTSILGGRFRVESVLGAGTCTLAEFPLGDAPLPSKPLTN
ncbi:MAG: PAS domain-containing protein [Janthinobacterium lividum]